MARADELAALDARLAVQGKLSGPITERRKQTARHLENAFARLE